jgi:hypothetical protein
MRAEAGGGAPGRASGRAAGCTVVVFAKAPVAGRVKTRLIPLLGARGAARLQERLIERTLARARDAGVGPVELWVAGAPGHAFVRACARRFGAALRVQRGADLGQRMTHAFERVLGQASRCVLIGTDCPGQTGTDLQRAAAALLRRDVVLQPAEDGGYVLVGLRQPRRELFEGVSWGGPDVLAQTERRIAALGLAPRRLRRLPDLDTVDDYRRAQRRGWIAG